MEDRSSPASFDFVEGSALTWQEQVHKGLKSAAVRLRLRTYSTLSTKCSESKEMQKQVGQFFGGATSSLINVIFDDLYSTDKTLRIAAARVLCLMAYENLTNQQVIIRSQADGDEEQIGVTVGWVHVFSVPQLLRDRYELHCEERGLFTTPKGQIEFISNVVKDNYASIYSRIGRYYAEGCREFLPLCWSYSLVNDSSEITDMIDVPDPSENVLGFYLVPRQMQFPEQDDYFLHDMLASIQTKPEVLRLQQVHTAFQQVVFRTTEANTTALKTTLQGVYSIPNKEEDAVLLNQQDNKVFHWLESFPKRMVTWNELLTWSCTDMNTEEMLKRFGAESFEIVNTTFRRLTLGSEVQEHSYVWEPVFVGALLDNPDLPAELKSNIRALSSGYVNRHNLSSRKAKTDKVWEYLFPLKLTEIHPISWSVFLSKWRQSADAKPDEEPQIIPQGDRRHHSVGEFTNPALLIARKKRFSHFNAQFPYLPQPPRLKPATSATPTDRKRTTRSQ